MSSDKIVSTMQQLDDLRDNESDDDDVPTTDWVHETADDASNAQPSSWVKGDDLNAKLSQFRAAESKSKEDKRPPAFTVTPPANMDMTPPAQDVTDDVDHGGYGNFGDYDIEQSVAPPEEMKIEKLKAEGNTHFKAGRFALARKKYAKAHEVYDGRKGGDAAQRADKVKVLGNLAEACLKLQEWTAALKWANGALELEPSNTKAKLRRARALAEVGGLTELDGAIAELHELARANGGGLGSEQRQLLSRLMASRKALHAQTAESAKAMRAAFASGGGLGNKGAADEDTKPAVKSPLFVPEDDVAGVGMPVVDAWADAWADARAAREDFVRTGVRKGPARSVEAPEDLIKAFELLSKRGPEKALPAMAKAEWLCNGLNEAMARGGSQFRRFRANASMRLALLDVPGGKEFVGAIGYQNVGPSKDSATDDDWFEIPKTEGGQEEADASLRKRCEAALMLFGRVKELLREKGSGQKAAGGGEKAAGGGEKAEGGGEKAAGGGEKAAGGGEAPAGGGEAKNGVASDSDDRGAGGAADGAPKDMSNDEAPLPPVDAHNGGVAPWGTFSQTREEVQARLTLPAGTRAAEVRVNFFRASLHVFIRTASESAAPPAGAAVKETVIVSGALHGDVVIDDCVWQLGDDGALELTLPKAVPATKAGRFGAAVGWWPRVLASDPPHDVIFCDAGETYVQVDKRAAGMMP